MEQGVEENVINVIIVLRVLSAPVYFQREGYP